MCAIFIFSLKFQKQGDHSEAEVLLGILPKLGLLLLLPPFPCCLYPLPFAPCTLSPPKLGVSEGLQRRNLLNYSLFHVTEQFQRCHILLFGDLLTSQVQI